jgi:hypothetical protein
MKRQGSEISGYLVGSVRWARRRSKGLMKNGKSLPLHTGQALIFSTRYVGSEELDRSHPRRKPK